MSWSGVRVIESDITLYGIGRMPVTRKKVAVITGASINDRSSILSTTRNLKMARSAHAYVRGSTVKFYDWLKESSGKVPSGPPIWICGDCHVGNLGPIADGKGRVAIQIRDLDQTVVGNPAHDLIRLGLSLASAARSSDLPGVITAKILGSLMEGYEAALAGDFVDQKDRSHRPKLMQKLLNQAVRRNWNHLAQERLETDKPEIPLGKSFWKLVPHEREAIERLVATEEVRRLLVSLKGRDGGDSVQLLDAVCWMKGCSSLGRLRFAVLVRLGNGRDSTLCLVDIKEAVAAAAPSVPKVKMPRDNAARVVMGAKALSPHLGGRMLAVRLFEKACVIRELMPQDLKIEIDRLSQEDAITLARYLANVVGRAHRRQLDEVQLKEWMATLTKNRTPALDAPSWLWSSVVDLVSVHEAAYLDHCRRHALTGRRDADSP